MDDVLGILVLTVVVGIAEAGSLSMGEVGGVTLKAVGFWVGLTGGGLLLARSLDGPSREALAEDLQELLRSIPPGEEPAEQES